MKQLLKKIWKQRVIFIFVFISLTLWFLSRLSYNYTSRISVDVELITDFASNVWVKDPNLSIDVVVEADGRLLALYDMGLMPRIEVESSLLKFVPTDMPYKYTIEPSSLRKALQAKEARMTIRYIADSVTYITVSPMNIKRLPIKNNITVKCRRQYMTIGGVQLAFDSVTVKAPQIILDTLHSIPTKHISYEHAASSIQGSARLVFPVDVYPSVEEVGYRTEITGFTEMQFRLPISAQNLPRGMQALIVPAYTTIKIKVPLDKFSHDIKPHATVNYQNIDNENRSTLLPVSIDSLPQGAELIFIDPEFVEPFFQKQ